MGVGGSIPFIAEFLESFPEASVLVTGVEDPDTRAHGANEGLHLAEFERVCLAEALLLRNLAEDPPPPPRPRRAAGAWPDATTVTVSLSGREQLRTPVRSGSDLEDRSVLPQNKNEQHQQADDPTGAFHLDAAASSATSWAAPRWWSRPTSVSPAPRPATCRRRRSRRSCYDLDDVQTDAARPTAQPDHHHRQRGRHRVLRAAADGGRPGHHHLDGDDHRRGARPAGGEGRTSPSPPRVPSCCSTSSPAAPTPPSRRTPRSGSPPRSPRARCSRPPRSSSASRSALLTSKDGVITAPDGCSVDVRRARRRRPPAPTTEAGRGRAQGARRTSRVIGTPQQPGRRARHRHRAQEVRDGPRRCPDALPTMVCRPPTLNGTPKSRPQRGRGPGDARRHRRRR